MLLMYIRACTVHQRYSHATADTAQHPHDLLGHHTTKNTDSRPGLRLRQLGDLLSLQVLDFVYSTLVEDAPLAGSWLGGCTRVMAWWVLEVFAAPSSYPHGHCLWPHLPKPPNRNVTIPGAPLAHKDVEAPPVALRLAPSPDTGPARGASATCLGALRWGARYALSDAVSRPRKRAGADVSTGPTLRRGPGRPRVMLGGSRMARARGRGGYTSPLGQGATWTG